MRQIPGPGEGRDIIVGSIGDTWGVPLTRDMVNSNGFSLKLWYGCNWDRRHTIEVDYIEMIVYYGNPFGDIEAQTVKLTGTPARPSDAVNRGYVDSRVIVSSNISDGTVTGEKLADGAVTALKLADDVDNRYVCKDRPEEQVMAGPLVVAADITASNINVSTPNWHVGSAATMGNVIIENAGGSIIAQNGHLLLSSSSGFVVAQKPLTFSAASGARGVGVTGNAIPCPACSANAQVIITPTSAPPQSSPWYVTKQDGSFTVHCEVPVGLAFTFDWVVIPSSP